MVVVGVEPFLHRKSTDIPFFALKPEPRQTNAQVSQFQTPTNDGTTLKKAAFFGNASEKKVI